MRLNRSFNPKIEVVYKFWLISSKIVLTVAKHVGSF